MTLARGGIQVHQGSPRVIVEILWHFGQVIGLVPTKVKGKVIYMMYLVGKSLSLQMLLLYIQSQCTINPTFALFNLRSTYFYVSAFYAPRLNFSWESLFVSLCVPNLIGYSLDMDHVYRSFIITVRQFDIQGNIIILDNVDFDVILGMVLFSPFHVVLDCLSKTITLFMPNIPPIS